MLNPLKYFRNRKVGLVLGSGGAKGVAHVAVIDYLNNMGIPIDMIAGSSIGAVVGALYCSGVLKKFKEDLLRRGTREMYSLVDPVFPRAGLIHGKRFMDFLGEYIPPDTNIEDLPIPLGIVATDYNNGKAVVFRSGNLLEAVRASMSIPGVFVPVRYRSTFLLDGGVSCPLPVNVAKQMGAGLTVAVNLHPRLTKGTMKSYLRDNVDRGGIIVDSRDLQIETVKEIPDTENLKEGNWLKSIESWLGIRHGGDEQKPPSIFETISQAIDIMEFNNTALMLKFYNPSVLIEPNLVEVGTLDFSDISHLISEGYLASNRVRGQLIRKVKAWV